jgi:hypothetical protein
MATRKIQGRLERRRACESTAEPDDVEKILVLDDIQGTHRRVLSEKSLQFPWIVSVFCCPMSDRAETSDWRRLVAQGHECQRLWAQDSGSSVAFVAIVSPVIASSIVASWIPVVAPASIAVGAAIVLTVAIDGVGDAARNQDCRSEGGDRQVLHADLL